MPSAVKASPGRLRTFLATPLMRFVGGVGVTTAGSVVASALSALTVVVLIRNYAPHDWGIVAGVTALGGIGALVFDFGSARKLTRDLSGGRATQENVRSLLSARILVGMGSLLVAVVVTPLLPGAYGRLGLAVAASAIGRFVLMGYQAPLFSQGRFLTIAALGVIEKVVGIVLVVVWLRLGPASLELWALSQSVGIAVSLVLTWVALGHGWLRLAIPRSDRPWRLWRDATAFGLSSVVGSLIALDVTVVNTVAGPTQGGIFAVGSRLAGPLALVGGALSAVALPVMARDPGFRPSPRSRRLFRLTLVAAAPLGLAIVIVGPPLVVRILGQQFAASLVPVRLYICAALLNTAAQPLISLLQARGYEGFAARALSVGVAISLGFTAIGAWLIGATGASAGFLIANAFLLVVLLLKLRSSQESSPVT